MENLFRACLFIVGLINLLPSLLAFLPSRIGSSYGIEVPDDNYQLLFQHRAVLFGIVAGLLIYSAFSKKLYEPATLVGLVSMLSFILLFLLIGPGKINPELTRVMWIDVAGLAVLALGYAAYRFG